MSRYRHEYKYYLDGIQEKVLLTRAEGLLQRDFHAGNTGYYWIRSLYFDDYDNSGFYDVLNGVDRRSKYRIRYYDEDSSYIKLEKKSKIAGMTRKDSCSLSIGECRRFMNGEIPFPDGDSDETKMKLLYEMQIRNLKPKVIVTYRRHPFIYPVGNVRVTFDQDITSSNDIVGFLDRSYIERPVLQSGRTILEVKWDEFLPIHIKEHMRIEELQWTNFSKYYMCRKNHL